MRQLCLFGITVLLLGASEPAVPALVRDLGADDFDKRLEAERALTRIGPDALRELREAAKGDDPEIAFRATRIIETIEWGVLTNAPKEIVELARLYRHAPESERRVRLAAVLEAAAKVGKAGVPSFRAIADQAKRKGGDPTVPQQVLASVRRSVPQLLYQGRDEDAEAVLETSLSVCEPSEAAADYVAFAADRGKTDGLIARFEKQRKSSGAEAEAAEHVLVRLYRHRGELPKALELADRIDAKPLNTASVAGKSGRLPPPIQTGSPPPKPARPNHTYRYALLADAGRWADLLAELPANAPAPERAVLLQLAGNTKELDDYARKLRDNPPKPGEDPAAAVKALLLIGRPDDAAKAADRLPNSIATKVELSAMRLRMAEALELPGGEKAAEALKEDKPDAWRAWQMARVYVYARLGQMDEVRKLIAEINGNGSGDVTPPLRDIQSDLRDGRLEKAFEKAAKLIEEDEPNSQGRLSAVCGALFLEDSTLATAWWTVLRGGTHSGKPIPETLGLIHRLFVGKATRDEYETAVRDARAVGERTATPNLREALLAAALAAGNDDDAEELYRAEAEAVRPSTNGTGRVDRPWREWASFLSARGREREAAAVCYRGWERDPDSAVLLYLSGRALLKTGDEETGTRRVNAAFRTLLGNEIGWEEFLRALLAVGRPTDLKRAADAFGKACPISTMNPVASPRMRAVAYRWAEEYEAAARVYDCFTYQFVTNGGQSNGLVSYLRLPARSRVFRAYALLAAGKPTEAAALASEYFRLNPDDAEEAIHFIPALDRAGAKSEAEIVYRVVREPMAAVVKDHPTASMYQNNLAWTMSNCHRDLPTAVAHARKATELTPDNTGNKDTLAEALFRAGEKDKAIEIMRDLVSKTRGTNPYYRRQLARFQTGDVTTAPSEVPQEANGEEE